MAQFTEEEKTIRRIEKRFNKGMVQYGLIEEGDKVLVGLSGGKDSLALVELLGKRSHISKISSIWCPRAILLQPCSLATVNRAFLRFHEQRKQGDLRVSVEGSKEVS